MDPYIGEIRIFAYETVSNDWAACNGQRLTIRDNKLLYDILGTTYGGDGQTYFNLPDMRGRGPIGMGCGKGLSPYRLGQKAGTENLVTNDVDWQNGVGVLRTNGIPDGVQQLTINGTHSIMQPALPLNFMISLWGMYPGPY